MVNNFSAIKPHSISLNHVIIFALSNSFFRKLNEWKSKTMKHLQDTKREQARECVTLDALQFVIADDPG